LNSVGDADFGSGGQKGPDVIQLLERTDTTVGPLHYFGEFDAGTGNRALDVDAGFSRSRARVPGRRVGVIGFLCVN
jgi:hypothetical protein